MRRLVPALLLGVVALAGCSPEGSSQADPAGSSSASGTSGAVTPAPSVSQAGAAGLPQAADVLASLPIKGRAPKTGYSREQFGAEWSDNNTADPGQTSDNGCDTRNDILKRDLVQLAFTDGGDCKVTSGMLNDPYSGKTINFVRGQQTSSAVQIDHVVALSDAWQKGAQQISASQRLNLANDPRNLMAADGPLNGQKGDSDAASWLPPNKSFRCIYVARQVGVKSIYKLWVTQAEKEAISAVLASCPGQTVPFAIGGIPASSQGASSTAPSAAPSATTSASAPTAAAPVPEQLQSSPVSSDQGLIPPQATTFANCTEAKAAGAAPVRRGDPGYSSKLDRDGDGIGCEN